MIRIFALLRGEGAHGKVQWEMQAAFSGGAELQKHSHIVGLGLYNRFEIAHGDEVSSELNRRCLWRSLEGMGSVRRSRSLPGFLTLTVLAVNLSVQGDPGQKRRQCQRCHE